MGLYKKQTNTATVKNRTLRTTAYINCLKELL